MSASVCSTESCRCAAIAARSVGPDPFAAFGGGLLGEASEPRAEGQRHTDDRDRGGPHSHPHVRSTAHRSMPRAPDPVPRVRLRRTTARVLGDQWRAARAGPHRHAAEVLLSSGRITPITPTPATTTSRGPMNGSPNHRPVERTTSATPKRDAGHRHVPPLIDDAGRRGHRLAGRQQGADGVQHHTEPTGEGEHHDGAPHHHRVDAVTIGEPAGHARQQPTIGAARERPRRAHPSIVARVLDRCHRGATLVAATERSG